MTKNRSTTRSGVVLVGIVILILIITIIGMSVLSLARSEFVVVHRDIQVAKAFYLAEAGLAHIAANYNNRSFDDIAETDLAGGQYWVTAAVDANNMPFLISSGRYGGVIKSIRVEPAYLSGIYEKGIHAGNSLDNTTPFALRGEGVPENRYIGGRTREVGGADTVYGDVYVNGDVHLFEESAVHDSRNAPTLPTYPYAGDVDATGKISVPDGTDPIDGINNEGAPVEENPDLQGMKYATTNDYHIRDLYTEEGIVSGRLPTDHELSNVLVKNPFGSRTAECDSTSGDDYFLEPSNNDMVLGNQKNARTPLKLGNDKVYYVDGNVWIHSAYTYGFEVEGRATIVATGNIHICDNVSYKNEDSLLGLVALGQYDDGGNLTGGGNIYFGDPAYGTTYTVSALMFAADSFLYNTASTDPQQRAQEPTTGFEVFGNFAALNKVSVQRDWYTSQTGARLPARYDPHDKQWYDLANNTALTAGEITTLRHYQMKLRYDDRVRSPETQPPGLPRGGGSIFAGLTGWQELPTEYY